MVDKIWRMAGGGKRGGIQLDDDAARGDGV